MIKFTDITLSLDTVAYAANDVLADTQTIDGALSNPGEDAVIKSIFLLDKDDQGQALDLVFLEDGSTIGTENAAVSISDANAAKIYGIVEVAAADYVDLINSQAVTKTDVNIPIKGATDKQQIHIAAISRGTGTYTASGITIRIGIEV